MRLIKRITILIVGVFVLVACAEESNPVDTVDSYLNARVASDADELQNLSCVAWEPQARLQADSFRSMDASLDNVTCERGDDLGEFAIVACDGNIKTTYNGETREWDLPNYQLIQEDGEWKICGEAP